MCEVTALIPCFNERDTIRVVVEETIEALRVFSSFEVIVIDDGSTDGGVDGAVALRGAKIFRHSGRRGKGAAIRTGLGFASGQVVVVQDADREYSPRFLPTLALPVLTDEVDAVFGRRAFHGQAKAWHRICNQWFSRMVRTKTGLPISDVACGHKAIRADLLRELDLCKDGFEWDVELVGRIARHRTPVRLQQLEVSYQPRGRKEGKKLTWADGILATWAALFQAPGVGKL